MTEIVGVPELPVLSQLYASDELQASGSTPKYGADSNLNDKISIIRNDITRLHVDAIVNAANRWLGGGGGVDGAIHAAAGPMLLRECKTLGGCLPGSAKITNAYELPSKKVIHAVGPIYKTREIEDCERLLTGCYTTSLDLAVANSCKTIAFPAISTGVYGYPSEDASHVALEAVRTWLDNDPERAAQLECIVFCSFLAKDEEAYAQNVSYVIYVAL